MENVRKQVRRRMTMKYNWKRIPFTVLEKLQRKFFRIIFARSKIDASVETDREGMNLGIDELGRDVFTCIKKYVEILLQRGVKLHTVIVLGSRVKGRWKPESDVDVMVIASGLPGRSIPEPTNFVQKVLNIRRSILLSDAPLFVGIQPSACCSKEEFLQWLKEFRASALDAVYFGKVIYDDGFWKHVLNVIEDIEKRYKLDRAELKQILSVL